MKNRSSDCIKRAVITSKKSIAICALTFVLTVSCFASQFSVLHSFNGALTFPESGLTAGPSGKMYGTTAGLSTECPRVCGTVFEFERTSSGTWRGHAIHTFGGPNSDGESPRSPLIFDNAGNLYGTTFSNGSSVTCIAQHSDCGTIFELSPSSNGGWIETVLYRFTGQADGAFPLGNMVFDSSGNLYGAALGGGSFSGSACIDLGCGVVYELSPGASGWTEKVLHTFTGGSDGQRPNTLTLDAAGNLLGLADHGGNGYGTVFQLVSGGGGWTFSVLYAFTGGSDGAYPSNNLLLDSAGDIYGTASGGGLVLCAGFGCGTVFELSPNGSGWTLNNLYSFSGPDGEQPHGLLFDASGNILGVAYGGIPTCPAAGCGVLFKLAPGSGTWTESVLFTFNGSSDGEFPNPVVMDSAGNLFGTAAAGGTYGNGTLFEFVP